MEYIIFYEKNNKYGCFSNFYDSSFTIDGKTYKWSEQYMMAEKARLFEPDAVRKIMEAETPAECKKLGRLIKNYNGSVWDEVREETVYRGVKAKFEQNPEIKEILIGTGDAYLAEAKDKIWGIGITKKEAQQMDPKDWPGKNLLGKILMRVRYELR